MHKTFYASGFIYHLPTQQILLQQKQSTILPASPWVLFEKEHAESKNPEEVFKAMLSKLLNCNLNNLNKIYSYTKDHSKTYSLFYASVDQLKEFSPKNGYVFKWFSFKEIVRLKTNEQTKHDIMIGQRVITALSRDNSVNLQKMIVDAVSE